MRLSIICPFRDELHFARAWWANVIRFADEIILYDTDDSDTFTETRQYFELHREQFKGALKIKSFPIAKGSWNHGGIEHVCRNAMLADCRGDWILALDVDELLGQSGIDFLHSLPQSMDGRKIAKFVNYEFWGNLYSLRRRSLWPPVSIYEKEDGRHWKVLRNWRGMFPSRKPRLFQNNPYIRYAQTDEHCYPEYKGRGRWTYRDKKITLDTDVPLFHFHYAFGANGDGSSNRDEEFGKKVNLIHYEGPWPEEVALYAFE